MGNWVVVGAGWLGSALGRRVAVTPIPRRQFRPEFVSPDAHVFVASGRRSVDRSADLAAVLDAELGHMGDVLDACEAASAARVVVLGSSDVAGLETHVSGRSAQSPLTKYAKVKVALENECLRRAERGVPVTVARLAPVHGAGKAASASLVRLARRPVVPLPGGGRQSIGFVLLDDAVEALHRLAQLDASELPPVVSIGAGDTPLRWLLSHLAEAQGRTPRWLPLPLPASAGRRLAGLDLPDSWYRLLRPALPRSVEMEVPVPVTPLREAAQALVVAVLTSGLGRP